MSSDPMPTATNSTAQAADSVLNGVVGVGIQAGEAILFVDFPWLAIPIVKPLVQAAIKFLSGYILKGLSQFLTFAIIDIQTGNEESAFNQALNALKAAQASGDPSQISTALKDFQNAGQNLGASDGSAAV